MVNPEEFVEVIVDGLSEEPAKFNQKTINWGKKPLTDDAVLEHGPNNYATA